MSAYENYEARFFAWLDNQLSNSEAEQLFIELQQHAPDLAVQMTEIDQLQQQADSEPQLAVPAWDRDATFDARPARAEQKLRWWQQPWLPITSCACSLAAVALVVAQSWYYQGQLEQQLMAQMSSYEAAQKQVLTQVAGELGSELRDEFQDDLTAANSQLVSYVLATSRAERREDFSDFIRYVNEQRKDDQVFYANQFRQLEESVGEPSDNTMPFYRASER